MLYVCRHNVILHTVAEDEAKLEALDIDASGLAAYGYAVISDTEIAFVTPAGELEWRAFEHPLRMPETAQQRDAEAFAAQYLNPFELTV